MTADRPSQSGCTSLADALLEMIDEAVIVHDDARIIAMASPACSRVLGIPTAQIVGRDCHEVFPPGGLCGYACAFKQGPAEEADLERRHDVLFFRPDGTKMKIRVRSRRVPWKDGRQGTLAVISDVTAADAASQQDRSGFHGIVGRSHRMQQLFATIEAVGASDYPVLITGESGTGKELVARAIHLESRRSPGPFVPVNCGALPDNILESELFGHVRGAFTGAIRDKKGRFELADGGTLFLDEVGELPVHMQVKLLRVLQEKAFERVGGEQSIRVDVRIVAATNRDLQQMVARGEFREDLYYRLCVVPLELPPLRERREDVPALIEHIVASIRAESDKDIRGVTTRAMHRLVEYSWPGNVRELINALQYASVHCDSGYIDVDHLPASVRAGGPAPGPASVPPAGVAVTGSSSAPPATLPPVGARGLSVETVRLALQQTGGNKVQAARLLGVGRATLYRFLRRTGEDDGGRRGD